MALDAANNSGNGANTGGGVIDKNNINKVIHLFASRAEQRGLEAMEKPFCISKNTCCLLCAGGGIVRNFYLINMGICWAERGLNFSLIDLETRAPAPAYFFGSHAEVISGSDMIHPSKYPYEKLYEKFSEIFISLSDEKMLKVLYLDSCKKVFPEQTVADNDTVNGLKTYILENSIVLVNLPEEYIGTSLLNLCGFEKFLFITRPDLKSIIHTYELIKKVFSKTQKAQIALLLHRSSDNNIVNTVYLSLARTVKIELGIDINLIGSFPDHEAIAESILERYPLALKTDSGELKQKLCLISNALFDWMGENFKSIPETGNSQIPVHIVKNMGEGI